MEGNNISPFNYEEVKNFSQGLAPVKKDGQWGAINTKGELVIPAIYDFMGLFKEGFAIVQKYGETFSINTKGERELK